MKQLFGRLVPRLFWLFLSATFLLLLFLPVAQPDAARATSHTSSPIAVTEDGRWVLCVNPDSNSLSLLSTNTLTLVAEITVGISPQAVAVTADGTVAYVANKGSDSVSVIDLVQRAVTATIAVGDRPVAVALSPRQTILAVAVMGEDRIQFVDTTSLAVVSGVTVADRPYGLSFTPDGRYVLASHLLSGVISRIPAQPHRRFLPFLTNAAIASTGEGATMEIATWPNVAPAPAVMVNPSGTRAYLPQTMANGLGLNTQFDNTVFPKVSVLNLDTWRHETSEHVSLPETDQPTGLPWAAALATGAQELWVVNAASNDVSVIDISNPILPSRRAHIPVGQNPRGLALSPDGRTAYVNNTLDGTITVIDTTTYGETAVVPVTDIPLPPLLLAGKRLFHASARADLAQAAWISCNTCHVEGEHDGRTWLLQFIGNIPPGSTPVITRNTTSLLGMIETYPLRWSAEWDESADSEFSIRFEQFGAGLIDGDMHPTLGPPNQGRSTELDALAAYIDSLTLPARSHALSAAEQRGRALFESPETRCLACHPPPLYTDLRQHDVGTARGPGEWFGPKIDTPTLRFLYDSSPYLHDGSADSVTDLLTAKNPDDEHGMTSHLTEQELADLAAYLLALPCR